MGPVFGQALCHHFVQIVATRVKFQGCIIVSAKVDIKSAYRCMHLEENTVLKSTLQMEKTFDQL